MVIGGPVGLPPLFFLLAGNSKTEEQKKRGKRDGRRTDRVTISVMPQFHCTLPPAPPPYPTIPIPVRSNRQLWQCHCMEHIVLHAVTSP